MPGFSVPAMPHLRDEAADQLAVGRSIKTLTVPDDFNREGLCIQPGKPRQNAHIERCNRSVRGEWLGQCIFETIQEAQNHATEGLWADTNERPVASDGGMTPAMKLKTAA